MSHEQQPGPAATSLTLTLLPHRLAVCRLEPAAKLPAWLTRAPFFAVTRTDEELSLVAPEDLVSERWRVETGFRAFRVAGNLEFSLVGILAELTSTLAAAGVSVFALSTYDTDYLLVRAADVGRARAALEERGHRVE